jgi:hypothetical protein
MASMNSAEAPTHPPMTDDEIEMTRVAQRYIIESLDRSKAAEIILTSDNGEQLSV